MIVEDIFRTMMTYDQVVIETPAGLANYDSGKIVIYKGSSFHIPLKLFNLPIDTLYATDSVIHILIEEEK